MSFHISREGSIARSLVVAQDTNAVLDCDAKVGLDKSADAHEPDLTDVGCYIHMLRGNLGPGCLSLPHAFAVTGIGLSLGVGVCVIIVCIFSFNILLWAKHEVVARGLAPAGVRLSYSDVALAALGPWGPILVEVSVCVTQLGVCTVYYSFVSTNVCSVFPGALHIRPMICAMMPIAGALTLIKTPGKLAALSTLGNACMFAGITLVLVALGPKLAEGWPQLQERPAAVWSTVAAFASNMIFSFEGIALMIPMEFAMIKQQRFPQIMTSAMTNVAIIFLAFAVYCLVGLGGDISSGSISASLEGRVPHGFVISANLTLAVAVLATYPLQFYPAIEIVDHHLERRRRAPWTHNLARLAISTACGVVALAVPNVEDLVNLVGSLGSPMLGLILPSLIHLRTHRPRLPVLMLDVLVFLTGVFAMVFGTYSSVRSIISH